jgi:hypothetical protein
MFFVGQWPLVPLLLLGPPFFPIILFGSTTLLTGMTGTSLHRQWPLTSQSAWQGKLMLKNGLWKSIHLKAIGGTKKLLVHGISDDGSTVNQSYIHYAFKYKKRQKIAKLS